VVLRDGEGGLEVLLLKRHRLSEVLGGAHVFPGGKVDPQDGKFETTARLDVPAHALHFKLGEPQLRQQEAAALHVAALRETFEETGVLYAHGADAALAARCRRLLSGGLAFDEVLARMSLRLAASSLQPWSRWITPPVGAVVHRRFDTRFFLARMPACQAVSPDNHEATESLWLTPRGALALYWEGAIELAPPQITSLAHLARHAEVDAALAEARAQPPPLIQPEPFEQNGVAILCYPGDERHSVPGRALPGPTRLRYRNGRYEPVGGLDALFAPSS
jgi:8-oxo-dGTP pyrophosphatase MutT (NUDIX family)